jgi:hypothetical protein
MRMLCSASPRVRQPALPVQEKPKPLAALHYNGLYAKSAGNALIYQTKAPLFTQAGPAESDSSLVGNPEAEKR